jgi:putative oxidoreductase
MKKLIGSHRALIVEIISALFIILFFYTALNKSYNIGSTVEALKRTKVFTGMESYIAWSVVAVEYLAAILLIIPKFRKLGLYASLILMAAFSLYVGIMMMFLANLPCSCGGVISKMTWKQHLIFNLFFTFLAFLAIKMINSKNNNRLEPEVTPVVFT